MTLTFGSLFTGIGGIDLGLEWAGLECRWQVEIHPYCLRVLGRHWPDIPKFTDIREVSAHDLEPVDLICGGFPCQDISNAGRRAGITGPRSGLWAEFARIVGLLRPRYVLVENVPALAVRGLSRVLGDLAACGYDAEWQPLSAAAFGAPHIRDRLFIVAYPKGIGGQIWPSETARPWGPPGARPVADARGQQPQQRRASGLLDETRATAPGARRLQRDAPAHRGAALANAPGAGCADLQGRQEGAELEGRGTPHGSGWWDAEPPVDRVVDGIPHRVDRLRGLGNAVVPQVAQWIGELILAHHERISQPQEEGASQA